MTSPVVRWTIDTDQIALDYENGLSVHLVDDSDLYETLTIGIDGELWII